METNVSIRPEVVSEFAEFWPSGIAVSRSGRIFVSFPRLDEKKATATLVEIRNGESAAFPDELVNAIDDTDRKHRFVSVHGIAVGPGNRLLALDTGAYTPDACEPEAAKLWVIDLDTDAILHGIGFPSNIVLPPTYLNDLVIDYARGKAGYAFISDSGTRGPNAIIVVDLDSGKAWRRLSGHPSVHASPPPGFGIATETGPLTLPGGIDGIALAPDGKTLWWTPLGTYGFFSVDTDILCEPGTTDAQIERQVVDRGMRDFASDGLDTDREGRVYLTDVSNGTVQRYIPAQNRFERLLGGTQLMRWPDAVCLGPDRVIYISDSQLNRGPNYNGGRDLRERPYKLYRAAIDADPAQY